MPSNTQLSTNVGTGALAATAQITHDGDTAQLQLIGLMGISGTEDAYTVAKINGDATNGLDVDVTRVLPGTAATALGKAEDAAHASGDVGVLALAVRRDAAAVGSDVDGDYSTLNVDASGRLHVNVGTSALPSGASTAANQSTANTALAAIQTAVEILDNAISGAEMQVDVVAALPAGTNNIGDVDVLSLVPGTGATALGKAVDAAAGATDTGVALLAVRDDSLATLTPVDGDYVPLRVNSTGALHVTGGGGGTEYAVDTALGATPTGSLAIAIRDDALSALTPVEGDAIGLRVDANGALWVIPSGTTTVAGTVTANLAAGTNNIGDVDVLSLPALPAGTNNIGDVDVLTVPADPFGANADAASATGSISAKLRFIAATGIPVTALPASTNTIEVVGDAAHDAAVAGNPILNGMEARSTDPTAVASGDVVRMIATLLGKQVVYPYAIPGQDWHYAAASGGIVNTTGVTARAAGGAGIRNYITRIQVINGHATVSTDFQIRDGAAGTVLWRGWLQAAGGGVAAEFDPPLRGTANTLVEIACGTTGSAVYANLHGFAAAE